MALLPETLLPETRLPETLLPETLLPETLLPETLLPVVVRLGVPLTGGTYVECRLRTRQPTGSLGRFEVFADARRGAAGTPRVVRGPAAVERAGTERGEAVRLRVTADGARALLRRTLGLGRSSAVALGALARTAVAARTAAEAIAAPRRQME